MERAPVKKFFKNFFIPGLKNGTFFGISGILYKRRIREMMEFDEFCDADNNIPKGILKIPADFKA